MPLVTFAPTENPSTPIEISVTPRVLVAQFGDGYEQRTGDGINTMRETVNLRWESIRATVASTIIAFFEARGGVEPFYYTLPGGGVQKKYICVNWSRQRSEANLDTVAARFLQSFTLEV